MRSGEREVLELEVTMRSVETDRCIEPRLSQEKAQTISDKKRSVERVRAGTSSERYQIWVAQPVPPPWRAAIKGSARLQNPQPCLSAAV